MTKHCGGCRRDLPLEAFAKHRYMKDGKQTQCRQCSNASGKAWRAVRDTTPTDRATYKLDREARARV